MHYLKAGEAIFRTDLKSMAKAQRKDVGLTKVSIGIFEGPPKSKEERRFQFELYLW